MKRWNALAGLAIVIAGCGWSAGDRPITWRHRHAADGGLVTTDPAGRSTTVRRGGIDPGRAGMVERVGPSGGVTFRWDDEGRPASVTSPTGTVRYAFDESHRLCRMEPDGAPAVEISYDAHGRPAVVSVGGLEHARYAYDFLGRLIAMDTAAGRVAYDYGRYEDETTFQKRSLPNGVTTIWKFAPSGRLISLRHEGPGETPIARYTCEYDAAGRLVKLVEHAGGPRRSLTYSYDAGQRLVAVTEEASDRGWSYGYDPLGGRITARDPRGVETAAQFDWAGRLVEHGGRPVSHDALGGITALGKASEDAFEYAADGRLVAARRGTARVAYAHDGEGQLASRETGTAKCRWVCAPMSDAFEPLAAVREDGSRTLYLWDRGRPLATVRYGTVEFFLADPLGSVRTVTDSAGGVVARRDFDPFGTPLEPPAGDEPVPGFAGMFYDPVAAVYLTPRRAYDPALGQFLQRDPVHVTPLGSAEDLSPYAYCGNDTVNLVDHSGARAARPRDRYAGYDPGSREVAERWNARVAAGTAQRSRVIQGNRTRTTYYDADGMTRAWATENDAGGDQWIEQEWRRAYVRARDSVEGLGREYAALVDRVGAVAAQQDPLAGMLQNARHYMDQFGPPPPDLLPRPVAGEANEGVPGYRVYDGATGELIELDGYGPVRRRPVAPGGGAVSPDPAPDSWVDVDPPPPGDAIDMAIDDVVGGVIEPTPAGAGGVTAAPADVPVRRRSDLEVFADLVEAIGGWSVPPVVTPDPPAYTPRGLPKSDLEVFRESIVGPSGGASPGMNPGDEPLPEGMRIILGPPNEPAAVGGVWLGGAVASLPDMGPLAGVAVDENGRLILLSRDMGRIDLPPLRLDDVVTIFRCVYEHGQSPYVSIDNDPKNPNGPLCTVRHGPGTAETYVGWILFHCDRVLKCYEQGFDNLTGKPFLSRVPGWRNWSQIKVDIDAKEPETDWSTLPWGRVWIAPAAVSRERAALDGLTLLEVPLKIRHKYREIVDGEFRDTDWVPEPHNAWGQARETSARWFNEHYDEVAAEYVLIPPAETGITAPVRIFAELKRIATIAAVAEALSAQGVPMPEWMRTYLVRPCPVDKTSPWLVDVEVPVRDPQGRTWREDGGVDLTPTDDLVKTVEDSPRAAAVAEPVARATVAVPALQPVKISTPEGAYRAVPLPGADTLDLGAARLTDADLVVPFGRGQRLELVRRFNSFFRPEGPWGPPWTLDLPTLEVLMSRTKNTSEGWAFAYAYRVTTPLGSISATLRERRAVPELGIETNAPDRPGDVLGMLGEANDPRIGATTERVAMRDGSRWHFLAAAEGKSSKDDPRAGLLAAVERGPHLVAYRWDENRRLTRIEGFVGPESAATIDLDYDDGGRLVKAVGGSGDTRTEAAYAYAADGSLATVTTPRGTRRYAYRDGLVASVHEVDPKGETLVVAYEYGPGGRLQATSLADGSREEYRVTRTPDGPRMETIITEKSGKRTTLATTFDEGMQPRERTLADGSVMSTEVLPDESGTKTTLALPDGRKLVEEASGDGTQRDFVMPSGTRFRKEYDPETRSVTISSDDQLIVRQTRNFDGTLEAIEFPGLSLRPRYDDAHRLMGTLVTGTDREATSYSKWLQVDYDAAGRPVQVTDSKGRKDRIERAADGRSATISSGSSTTTVAADVAGRQVTVVSSAGDEGGMAFDDRGRLSSVTLERGGDRAEIEFVEGRPVRGRRFDGGEIHYRYFADGPSQGRLERLTYPHGLVVTYTYDATGRIETATLGDVRRYRYARDEQGRLVSLAIEPARR